MGRKRHWWNKRPESGKDFSLLVSIPLDKVCVSFPVSIPLDKVSVQSSTNVHGLKCDLLSTLPRSWVDISPPTDSDVIIICKPSYYETSNTSRVQFTIQIKATFNWSVFYHFFYVYEQVLTITFDGAAANRRFLKLMGSEKVLFKVINKYSLEKRPLFFFSDPPHLLKTTRNCLASKARHLWVSIFCTCRSMVLHYL